MPKSKKAAKTREPRREVLATDHEMSPRDKAMFENQGRWVGWNETFDTVLVSGATLEEASDAARRLREASPGDRSARAYLEFIESYPRQRQA